MTRKRRLHLNAALVGLALTALAFDKLVLSGGDDPAPLEAAALELEAPDPRPNRTTLQTDDGTPLLTDPDDLLSAFDAHEPLRDPFELSETLRARASVQSQEQERGAKEGELLRRTAEEFQAEHRLDAVISAGRNPIAMVNGRAVRIGQTINGFELVAVQDRTAVFQRGEVRIELRIPIE